MSAEYSVESLQHLILSQHASTSVEAIAALRAFQERIKADEGAVPVGYTRVDCVETLKQQDFAPMIRLRQRGDYTVPLFTHTPAQAAKVDDGSVRYYLRWLVDLLSEHGLSEFSLRAQQMHAEASKALDAPTAEPAAQGDAVFPMTERQVIEWIDACNHEPCRQVLRDYLRLRDTHPHSPDAADGGRVTGDVARLVALWRQPPDCDEEATLFDKGYEQASAECADELEAALAAQGQGEPIGEVRENGVTWFRDNPHAFPIGTRFYTAPAASPAGAPDDLYRNACESVESWKVRALKAEETADRLEKVRQESIRKWESSDVWGGMDRQEACRVGMRAVISYLAAQPRAVPDGWALVPREPTKEMIEQGASSLHVDVDFTRRPQLPTRQRAARNAYVSMLITAAKQADR